MACDKPLGFCDPFAEVRRDYIKLRHPQVQSLKRRRVRGCWRLNARLFVVLPERECEPVSLVDGWFNTHIQTRHGTSMLGERTRDLDLKAERLLPH